MFVKACPSLYGILLFTLLCSNSTDDKLIPLLFPDQKIGSDISCRLPPMATINIMCQNLFLRKTRKYFKMSSAEISIQHAKRLTILTDGPIQSSRSEIKQDTV